MAKSLFAFCTTNEHLFELEPLTGQSSSASPATSPAAKHPHLRLLSPHETISQALLRTLGMKESASEITWHFASKACTEIEPQSTLAQYLPANEVVYLHVEPMIGTMLPLKERIGWKGKCGEGKECKEGEESEGVMSDEEGEGEMSEDEGSEQEGGRTAGSEIEEGSQEEASQEGDEVPKETPRNRYLSGADLRSARIARVRARLATFDAKESKEKKKSGLECGRGGVAARREGTDLRGGAVARDAGRRGRAGQARQARLPREQQKRPRMEQLEVEEEETEAEMPEGWGGS